MKTFREELAELINIHSLEMNSNTQDFILADYLISCLEAYTQATLHRESLQNQAMQSVEKALKAI